jgi:hypothetical protein
VAAESRYWVYTLGAWQRDGLAKKVQEGLVERPEAPQVNRAPLVA